MFQHNLIKNTIISVFFVFTLSSASCPNKSTLNDLVTPSVFIILDSYIAVQIDIAADNCFDRVDEQELDDEESYEKWYYCMRDYYEMESLLQSIKNNLEKGDSTNLKKNLEYLAGLLDLLGLEMPKEIKNLL